jgi:CDP-6-deoxy-D-xylo-4-hexulose-3-dehydrase
MIKFPTATSTWGEEELEAINSVLKSGRMTMGEKTEEFEEAYADYIGTKYCVAVNSGSSANLLMVAAYTLKYGRGTVIVPSIAWATSYAPFQQYGWKLKFVDVDRNTLNYDIASLRKAHWRDVSLILAVNLLGNPNDFDMFPGVHRIEDNCESMGAEYKGRKCGSFGEMGTHSTYFAHHMCTMEGGMVTTDDQFLYEMLISLRSHGWTRHFKEGNIHGVKPEKFSFIYPGYNVRPTDLQCAIGLAQLKKLPDFVATRHQNQINFREYAKKRGWGYQVEPEGGYSSSFGCALFTPDVELVKKEFDAKGIDYRPIMTGDFTKSPSIKYYDHQVYGDLPNTKWVEQNGIFVGNHHTPIDWTILD